MAGAGRGGKARTFLQTSQAGVKKGMWAPKALLNLLFNNESQKKRAAAAEGSQTSPAG